MLFQCFRITASWLKQLVGAKKVGAVSNAKIQTNVTEVRGFIELVNYVYNLYQVMLN